MNDNPAPVANDDAPVLQDGETRVFVFVDAGGKQVAGTVFGRRETSLGPGWWVEFRLARTTQRRFLHRRDLRLTGDGRVEVRARHD